MHAHNLANTAFKVLIAAHQLTKKFWFLCLVSAGLTFFSVAYAEEPALEIEKIRCEGNEKSTCNFIIQQTSLREGDPAQDEKLKEAVLKLKLIGHFLDANIRLEKGSSPGKAEAVIQVKEKSSYAYSISTGIIQPHEPVNAVADVTGVDKNFSGRGDSLSIRARGGYQNGSRHNLFGMDDQAVRLEYIRPSFLTPRMYLIAGLAGKRVHSHDSGRIGGWTDHTYWADLALGYKLFDYSFATLGFRIFPEYGYSNIFVQTGWDSQDNPYFPTQGSRLLIEFTREQYLKKRYSHWSNVSFNGAFLKHWGLGEGHVLSLRLGSLNGIDPAFRAREEEATSLRYTRILKKGEGDTIRKKAFYAEAGVFNANFTSSFVGAKLGTTLQTDAGVINLFLMGGGK